MLIMNDIVQGTDEWITEKLGKPSASNASMLITTEGKQSKQRKGYLYTLAAEIVSGKYFEKYKSRSMEVGNEREEESRSYYELVYGVEVEQVGMIYKDEDKKCLCSPDGIINREYGLELKNVEPKTQIGYLLSGKLPTDYICQIQFSLYVTGFKHWMFFSYSPGLPPLIVRVERNEGLIEGIDRELKTFYAELNQVVREIRLK